ncbi:MAG: hypothetical protein CMH61_02550 [Nanoarchaeota archaeon]|nr:hypothetical protein [Nanoarchaeota archaeon]|tara:strand:- start:11 stop:1402 length:1392 start_codon:yes stop_codon:yes gene_type:complete
MGKSGSISGLVEYSPPISISGRTAISSGNFRGDEVAIKSFIPSGYEGFDEIVRDQPPVTSDGGYKQGKQYYFEKEAQILRQLTKFSKEGTIDDLVPEFHYSDRKTRKIITEKVEGPTYRDMLVATEGTENMELQKQPLRKRLLEHVGYFQEQVNRTPVRTNLLGLNYSGNKPLTTLRSETEERLRLIHYLRLIVFSHSEEFRERYNIDDDWKYTRSSWVNVRRNVKQFMGDKGMHWERFINRILDRNRQILYGSRSPYSSKADRRALMSKGDLTIIHGDLGPQNIFYEPDNFGKIIDFDEMRIGSPQYDVVHAMYHVSSNPAESTALALLGEYASNAGENWQSYLAEHTAVRSLEGLRKIASDARMSRHDLLKFSGTVGDLKYASTTYLRRYNFDQHQKFIQFFRDGRGRGELSGSKKGKLVLEQLADLGSLFHLITNRNADERAFSRAAVYIRKQDDEGNGK